MRNQLTSATARRHSDRGLHQELITLHRTFSSAPPDQSSNDVDKPTMTTTSDTFTQDSIHTSTSSSPPDAIQSSTGPKRVKCAALRGNRSKVQTASLSRRTSGQSQTRANSNKDKTSRHSNFMELRWKTRTSRWLKKRQRRSEQKRKSNKKVKQVQQTERSKYQPHSSPFSCTMATKNGARTREKLDLDDQQIADVERKTVTVSEREEEAWLLISFS